MHDPQSEDRGIEHAETVMMARSESNVFHSGIFGQLNHGSGIEFPGLNRAMFCLYVFTFLPDKAQPISSPRHWTPPVNKHAKMSIPEPFPVYFRFSGRVDNHLPPIKIITCPLHIGQPGLSRLQ